MTDTIVADHFARWLRVGSGCSFAARFARGERRIAFVSHVGEPRLSMVGDVTEQFRVAARQSWAAVAVFPDVRAEAQLIELLNLLKGAERWRCRRVASSMPGLLVGVEWKTDHGPWSQTMGFAPLLTMPVTRRAPYVGIAAWPGPPRKAGLEYVGFIDMRSGFEKEQHALALAKTKEQTSKLLGAEAQAVDWHQVSFSLALDKAFSSS